MSTDGDMALVLAFDSDDAEFARGFEAGRIWSELNAERDLDGLFFHATNAEMVIRMAEAVGLVATAEFRTIQFSSPARSSPTRHERLPLRSGRSNPLTRSTGRCSRSSRRTLSGWPTRA